ncbi:MAG: FAD-dependent oxidoreductase [Bacteroidota bacterium]
MDYAIIGGGIFGVYAALFLAKKGKKVVIIEKEKQLFKKASIVNQARLHSGYHYPRSIATAVMSDENKARFTAEHKAFIHTEFEKYYGIERNASFTDSRQFERFCKYLNIRCDRIDFHPLFNYDSLDALYQTTEYTFDPILIAQYYIKQLNAHSDNISVLKYRKVKEAVDVNGKWRILIENQEDLSMESIQAEQVINATYAGSNTINRLFGLPEINLTHEISEMVFVSSKELANMGLTVMDGQFGSIMPYGHSGLLSLSSVAYTHHKISYEAEPHFDCMDINPDCEPSFISICNECMAKPRSNKHKMIAQMSHYFSERVQLHYFFSYFTIKSKLQANYIDDGRPTEISQLNDDPPFYCIFAGKINSIYEIEKVIKI